MCVFQSKGIEDLILMILTDLLRKVAKAIVICSIMMILLKSSFAYNASTNTGGPLIFHFCGGETPFTWKK